MPLSLLKSRSRWSPAMPCVGPLQWLYHVVPMAIPCRTNGSTRVPTELCSARSRSLDVMNLRDSPGEVRDMRGQGHGHGHNSRITPETCRRL
jgi:hypothetical protein